MRRLALALLLCSTPAMAWELDTHVGLTTRAAQRSELDGWLRKEGYETGAQEMLGMRTDLPAERALLDELGALDPALGVTPENGRQSALHWLQAGAALEGVGIDRLRNHFLSGDRGLDEKERLASWRVRFDDVRAGLNTLRGALTGVSFDGSGMPATRWLDSSDNELSRTRFLDAQADAVRGATPELRDSALARALVYAGAITHVLESLGDPANTRNDFITNRLLAGRPLERYAAQRWGLAPPPALTGRPNRHTLVSFLHDRDGSGLADEVGRTYRSPATLPEPLSKAELAATCEALLPRVGADAAALLDFLFRGSLAMRSHLDVDQKIVIVTAGPVPLGAGKLELYAQDSSGVRTKLAERDVTLGAASLAGHEVHFTEPTAKHVIALFRGVDAVGEPIVVSGDLEL